MKRSTRWRWMTWVLAALALFACSCQEIGAAEKSHYWEWGWGVYGTRSGLDSARFDWTLISFGNDPANSNTVAACNAILAINPRHKFVIRVWPCPHGFTFFHYFYEPGVRDKILASCRSQVELICKGVSKPENVVGITLMEELPSRVADDCYGARHKAGQALPEDLKLFRKEIEAELGAPFDPANPRHYLWWGGKYVQFINEINKTFKEAGGGRVVLHWQETSQANLSHVDTNDPSFFESGRFMRILPFHYEDIVKSGYCDGIFGYPNSSNVWWKQTMSVVNKLNCLFFSQVSIPPGMRLASLDEVVGLAKTYHSGNLGGFVFSDCGPKHRAHNQVAYQPDDTFWTSTDHLRAFAWNQHISQNIVDRYLAPRLDLDYSLTGLKKDGFVHVQAVVFNPRTPSWYGNSRELATMKNVRVTLKVPTGFSIPIENSAPPTISLGDLPPAEGMPANWWVRLDRNDPDLSATNLFVLVADAGQGSRSELSCAEPERHMAAGGVQSIYRAGDQWMEPVRQETGEPICELRAGKQIKVLCPELICGDRSVRYRGEILPGMTLRIGPGLKAVLLAPPLFEEKAYMIAREWKHGSLMYHTPRVTVWSGKAYTISVSGWAKEGGHGRVVAQCVGWRGTSYRTRHVETNDLVCLDNIFTEAFTTNSADFTIPEFENGACSLRFLFYRVPEQGPGIVYYQSFACGSPDVPVAGSLDVTARLEGVLPSLQPPFTIWTYRDLSDPNLYGRPKLELEFVPSPGEQHGVE